MAPRSLRARLTLPALVVAAAGISAGSALAAPAWLPGSTLSDPSGGAIDPSVAVAPGGEVVALWSQAPAFQIQAAIRPPGGSFSTATPISAAGAPIATLDHIAVDGTGNFLAVWRRNDGTNERIEFADRPAGGSFAAGRHITPDAGSGFEPLPDVALDPAGGAFVGFLTKPCADRPATLGTRTVGGAFTTQVVSAAGQSLPLNDPPVIAAGPAGDAVAL